MSVVAPKIVSPAPSATLGIGADAEVVSSRNASVLSATKQPGLDNGTRGSRAKTSRAWIEESLGDEGELSFRAMLAVWFRNFLLASLSVYLVIIVPIHEIGQRAVQWGWMAMLAYAGYGSVVVFGTWLAVIPCIIVTIVALSIADAVTAWAMRAR